MVRPMRRGPGVRLFVLMSFFASATAALSSACNDEPIAVVRDAGAPVRRPRDAGTKAVETDDPDEASDPPGDDAGRIDARTDDAKADAKVAEDARSPDEVDGPGTTGTECFFNSDCKKALRCQCDDYECTCKAGVRGTGTVGATTCTSGEDCASSLCIDGPAVGQSVCSGACKTAADCGGLLPRCVEISPFPSKICVRTPSSSN